MARKRVDFQKLLEEVLGSRKVYFQAPVNTQLVYPCIIYDREGIDSDHADDLRYRSLYRYNVTLITREADPEAFDRLLEIRYSSFDRHFVADKLHHNVFTIYY